MLEQLEAQVVHHPLARIHLHLGVEHRRELIGDLQRRAREHDDHEQRKVVMTAQTTGPALNERPERMFEQHVIQDDRERPGLQRAEPDLEQR